MNQHCKIIKTDQILTENYSITKINLSQLTELEIISKKTFIETFSNKNTVENMESYLKNSLSTEQLKSELNNSNSNFYFISIKDKIGGYLKINFPNAHTEKVNFHGLEIERIYILQNYQGKSVGQMLLNFAIDIAKANHFDYLWLGVWEKNLQAIQFYKKNGFEIFNQHIFKLGEDAQIDLMMKLKVN